MRNLNPRRIPYQPDKTEADRLGPIVYNNRKVRNEFKKLLDKLNSLLGKENDFSKQTIKNIFCLKNPESKKYIIDNLIKEYPEKGTKIIEIIDQFELFITGEHPVIKDLLDKQEKGKWPCITKTNIFFDLKNFVIENKYTSNFSFNHEGVIVDLDVAGNVINMDDN
jgi:hypothetical protein